jgi:hypothetical protein
MVAGVGAMSALAADFETLLILDSMGIPLYSGRGIKQTLKPISEAANLQRDVNGSLEDVSYEPFRKYETTITCTDMAAPALDGIWPGMTVVIDCVCELAYLTSTAGPSRTAVESSERYEGNFSIYRPRLTCKVTDFSTDIDEWPADVAWQLTAQEI